MKRYALTPREYDVLVLSSEGESRAGTAAILGITEATVRGYSKTMFLKLGARNMPHAVAIGYERSILTLGKSRGNSTW